VVRRARLQRLEGNLKATADAPRPTPSATLYEKIKRYEIPR
jgi:hypothetical protein